MHRFIRRVIVAGCLSGTVILECVAFCGFGRWLWDEPSWRVMFALAPFICIATVVLFMNTTAGTASDRVISFILFPATVIAIPFLALDDWLEKKRWPKTVDQAVDRLLRDLTRQEMELLCSGKSAVEWYSFGQSVRNNFGLCQGNQELLRSCGVENELVPADAASSVIIKRLIQSLEQGRQLN